MLQVPNLHQRSLERPSCPYSPPPSLNLLDLVDRVYEHCVSHQRPLQERLIILLRHANNTRQFVGTQQGKSLEIGGRFLATPAGVDRFEFRRGSSGGRAKTMFGFETQSFVQRRERSLARMREEGTLIDLNEV